MMLTSEEIETLEKLNLTQKGWEVFQDIREKANHAVVREALVKDAQNFGYELLVTVQVGNFLPEDEIFRLQRLGYIVTIKGVAQFALFLVEERLCQAGKIR